jgi:hypothetical protein
VGERLVILADAGIERGLGAAIVTIVDQRAGILGSDRGTGAQDGDQNEMTVMDHGFAPPWLDGWGVPASYCTKPCVAPAGQASWAW